MAGLGLILGGRTCQGETIQPALPVRFQPIGSPRIHELVCNAKVSYSGFQRIVKQSKRPE